MKNFKYLGQLNIKDIKKNILNISNDKWDEFDFRQKTYDVHRFTKTIPIIFDIDDRTENPTYLEISKNYKKELNYLNNLFENKLGKGFIISSLLVKLLANSKIGLHIDSGESISKASRMHIPIITNDNVYFQVGEEIRNLKEGEIWEINNTGKQHAVQNDSKYDRVHLIVDWITYDRL